MAKPSIVPATLEHVERMAPHMRDCDRREIWASSRQRPEDSLRHGVLSSTEAWTGLIDDEIACLFGVVPQSLMGGSGYVWMLATPLIEQHQILFLRRCRPVVKRMMSNFTYLHNYVDERNTSAIRWLQWLGFTMGEPEPYGVMQLPFRHFEMRLDHV